MDQTQLQLKLHNELVKIKKNHPSFQLMGGPETFDSSLIPFGKAVMNTVISGIDESGIYNFHDFIKRIWTDNTVNILYVCGDGGVGKTVSLLEFATTGAINYENIPAIYIPLHELNGDVEDDCIRAYLRKRYRGLANEIEDIAELERKDEKPNLVLLLDGANEIYSKKDSKINKSISYWASKDGTFIIITSRHGETTLKKRLSFELMHIGVEDAQKYLKKVLPPDTHKVPKKNAKIYKILDTPLMLNLYAQIELYRKETSNYEFLEWEDSESSGHVIWNYLQKELHRCADKQDDENIQLQLSEYALLIRCIAPYVCYQMEKKHSYKLTRAQLKKHIRDAYQYYGLKSNHIKQIENVEDNRAQALVFIDRDNIAFEQKIQDLCHALTNDITLFRKEKGTDRFALMHQSFRDCLAAIYLIDILSLNDNKLPDEYGSSFSTHVAEYFADIIKLKDLRTTWERNRKNLPTNKNITNNLLRVYSKKKDGDLSTLDWSGMDLQGINLYSFKSNSRLMISKKPDYFKKTKISVNSFLTHGHTNSVSCVVFSHDGHIAASVSHDKTICFWDPLTHNQIGIIHSDELESINTIAFSEDGALLASGADDGRIFLWSVIECKQIDGGFFGHTESVNSIVFSNDMKTLISASDDQTIRIWDIDSQKQIGKPLTGHTGFVNSVSISKDDKIIISGSDDKTIRLWNVDDHKQICDPLKFHKDIITCVVFNRDCSRFASSSADCTIGIWDLQSKKMIGKPLIGHENCISSIQFDKTGDRIFSGSFDCSIRIWDTNRYEQIGETIIGHTDYINSISFNEADEILISGSEDKTVRFWDVDSYQQIGAPITRYEGAINTLSFLNNSHTFASGSDDGLVRLWSLDEHKQISEALSFDSTGSVNCIAINNDDSILAVGTNDNQIHIWDLYSKQILGAPLSGHGAPVNSISINNDSTLIASGSDDGIVRLWSIKKHNTVKRSLNEHTSYVNAVEFSSDGKLLVTGSQDATVRIWKVSRLHPIKEPLLGHTRGVTSIAINKDGKWIFSGSEDGNVLIWNVESHRKEGPPLEGHTDVVTSLSLSPNGTRIISGSRDRTIRIWNRENHLPIGKLSGHTDWINSVACSKDGSFIISGSDDGTIRVWDARRYIQITEPICPLPGIDLFGLDFSKADINDYDRTVFIQNGVNV